MKHLGIRWRLILIFVLTLMPVCALILLVQSHFFSIMKTQASLYTAQYIEKISYDIELNLSELDKMAATLQQDSAVRRALKSGDGTKVQQRMKQILQQNSLAQKTGSAILLLNGSQRIIASTYDEWTGLLRILGSQWLSRIISSNGERVLISGYSITKGSQFTTVKVVSMARAIYEDDKLLGYLMVEVPTAAITQLCEGVSLGTNGFVALVDMDDYVIYNTRSDAMGSKFMPVGTGESEKTYRETSIHGVDMLLVEPPASVSGIRMVGAIPMSELQEEVVQVRRTALLALGGIAMVMFIAVTFLTRRICRPIVQMESAMKRVEKGDFSVRVPENRHDEIGSLQRGFNHMLGQVDELIAQEYKSTLRHREAQLNEMMAIINPHFIYNTLEAISMTAYLNGDEEAVEMIGRLGAIFRAMTGDRGSRMLPLRQELQTVEDYLALINVRQDGRILVDWQVDESLLDTNIMKFTLQPIVENSVLHGFSRQQGGHIWIRIELAQDESVSIIIEDDGSGVDRERLEHLRRVLADEERPERPMALKNVHDRLRLVFGPEYGLTAETRAEGGMRICLRIPLTADGKGETHDIGADRG